MKFIAATKLKQLFQQASNPVLIDMSQPDQPPLADARRVDFNQIVCNEGDRAGLLPANEDFNQALTHTGITPKSTVFLFDDTQGLAASRLAWSLMLCGLTEIYLIDGGREALLSAGWPLANLEQSDPDLADSKQADTPLGGSSDTNQQAPAHELKYDFSAHYCHAQAIADQLGNPDEWLIIDARSEAEYKGSDRRSRNAGHIPGAIHFDWQWFFDPEKPSYLLPDEVIRRRLKEKGITAKPGDQKAKTIAVYCQSHRRSSLMFCVLKHLGYADVRGYPGAWSDWGNCDDLPVEC